MPKAIIDTNDTSRYELKSCPGGFVVLRRLTYGQWLQRQQDALSMSVEQHGKKGNRDLRADMQVMGKKVALWEFANCIVEHNLEDGSGQLLNFKQEFTLEVLDPRIGQEIGDLISAMNEFADAEGNSMTASEPELS